MYVNPQSIAREKYILIHMHALYAVGQACEANNNVHHHNSDKWTLLSNPLTFAIVYVCAWGQQTEDLALKLLQGSAVEKCCYIYL